MRYEIGQKNGGLDFQNRRRDMYIERTKATCPTTVFLSPSGGAGCRCVLDKKTDNHKGSDLVCYRLCVCASGPLITDIFSCRAEINVSCLHLGQYNGKFSRTVSSRIRTRVLESHTGHYIHVSIIVLYRHSCRS